MESRYVDRKCTRQLFILFLQFRPFTACNMGSNCCTHIAHIRTPAVVYLLLQLFLILVMIMWALMCV